VRKHLRSSLTVLVEKIQKKEDVCILAKQKSAIHITASKRGNYTITIENTIISCRVSWEQQEVECPECGSLTATREMPVVTMKVIQGERNIPTQAEVERIFAQMFANPIECNGCPDQKMEIPAGLLNTLVYELESHNTPKSRTVRASV